MSREVEVAMRAAERGAEVVRAAGLGTGTVAHRKELPGDYVTEVDLASEEAIAKLLSAEGGGVPVHGEESGGDGVHDAWVVDPLDGTTNFAHGFPLVGVSVALVRDGAPVSGAICAPFLRETWFAGSGEGAWHRRAEDDPVRVSVSTREPERAVVGTGFPFRRKELLARYLRTFDGALSRFEDLRRPGAAALDLAWVAAGAFDGFFELGLSPWDVAAGGLLIEEAGGVVTDWEGGDGWLGGDILAGGQAVHAELLRLAGA
ncbi:MAG: inositol monophosphatase [Actinomycetota bacterium]|nr:inositol monophosphatase [Actinomycetota bacterium]